MGATLKEDVRPVLNVVVLLTLPTIEWGCLLAHSKNLRQIDFENGAELKMASLLAVQRLFSMKIQKK